MTTRRPTPRPVYDEPTKVTGPHAVHHLWGDADGAQYVSDQIFVSSDVVHVMEYQLPPHGKFLHSEQNPTLFASDVAYIVLSGEMLLVDAEHGEVRHVLPGQVGFFQRDTWHHAFNPSSEPLRVLEYMTPPPSKGTASTYGRTKPLLTEVRHRDDRWNGRWPAARDEREATARIHVITEADHLLSLPDGDGGHVAGLAVDTEYFTLVRGRVRPGHAAQVVEHDDESVLYVTEGVLRVFFPDAPSGSAWHTIASGEALFLPPVRYQIMEFDGTHARYWLGTGRPTPEGWQP
jgi:hypothetical protein